RAVDDRLEVYPRSTEAKFRGLQAHGHAVASAQAGQRTAVNLQGLERAAIARGDVVGLPGTLVSTLLVDGTLELLKDAPRAIKSRTRVRFHVGTSEIMARALLLDRPELPPGEAAFARCRLDALQRAGRVVAVDRDWFIHPDSFARLRTRVVEALAAFHRTNPLKPGMSREELRGRAGGADERVFAFLLSSLGAEGTVKTERDKVRLASHEVRLSPEQQRIVDRLEDDFLKAEAAPPSAGEALGK